MPKTFEYLESILTNDADGETYTVMVYQEFAVNYDEKLPTYKVLKLADGTPVRAEQDGSFTALGFDEIQMWPTHD